MTTAETNDAIRTATLKHFFFGKRQPPPEGSQLAYGSGVDTLHANARQALMETVLSLEDFDDDDHTASTFAFGDYANAYTASFTLTDNGAGKTLTVSVQ
jgi:hypothetical protein